MALSVDSITNATTALATHSADYIAPSASSSHYFSLDNSLNDRDDGSPACFRATQVPSSTPSTQVPTPQPSRSALLQLFQYYFTLVLGAIASVFRSSHAAHKLIGSSLTLDENALTENQSSAAEADVKLPDPSQPVPSPARASSRLKSKRAASQLATSSLQPPGMSADGVETSLESGQAVGTVLRRRVMSTSTPPPSRGLVPPPHHRTKTLVLDLDETLIHSTSRGRAATSSSSSQYCRVVEVTVDRHAVLYYVHKRPHVDYFLRKVAEWYRVVIFTASMEEYAGPVIDWLEEGVRRVGGYTARREGTPGAGGGGIAGGTEATGGGLFAARLYRPQCTLLRPPSHNQYTKDLAIIEPDLARVALVDNSPASYALNPENGIPIEAWFSDSRDEALLDLLPFLDALRFCEDMRSVLRLRGG